MVAVVVDVVLVVDSIVVGVIVVVTYETEKRTRKDR